MEYIYIDEYIKAKLGDVDAYIFLAKVKDILPIYYVAVRGRDNEAGAVQRILNRRRITAIADFVLEGNMFFNTFILNWTDEYYSIMKGKGKLQIPSVSASVQVIDGQHRLEGLKRANDTDTAIGENDILVILVEHISTQDAAKIFLNINTEQKPVPPSLVYDLFGEIKDKNYYIVRATDIGNKLHEDKESPYYQCIKLPGSAQGVGKIDLSTVVNALKVYTVEQGTFSQYNLNDFESQYRVVFNFFNAIKFFYEKETSWLKSQNPFMMNAGFHAGVKFLCEDIIPRCVEKRSFEEKTIRGLIPLNEQGLLFKNDIKNRQGKDQRNEIYNFLKSSLLREVPDQDEYKF